MKEIRRVTKDGNLSGKEYSLNEAHLVLMRDRRHVKTGDFVLAEIEEEQVVGDTKKSFGDISSWPVTIKWYKCECVPTERMVVRVLDFGSRCDVKYRYQDIETEIDSVKTWKEISQFCALTYQQGSQLFLGLAEEGKEQELIKLINE